MKLIFRYALLVNFTDKQDLVTKEQLREALRNAKYTGSAKEIDAGIERCVGYIREVVQGGDKRES